MNSKERPEADRLLERMAQVRTNLDRDAEKLFDGARTLSDWRYYVRSYPWACVGAAAALGFFLVPRKRPKGRIDQAELDNLLKRKKLVVQASQPARGGLAVGLAGVGLRILGQLAARELTHLMHAGQEEPVESADQGDNSSSSHARRISKPR